MHKKPRYGHLQGSSAYYPFGARTRLRQRQRRGALALRVAGVLALCLAAALVVRQVVFHGGQPTPPAAVALPSTAETADLPPVPVPIPVAIRAATVDALAATGQADAGAHASPAPQQTAAHTAPQEILPQYQAVYAQNPDTVGWLRLDGTAIDYPVVQTPNDNEAYLRRGFDRLYATGGTLFLDARCQTGAGNAASTANWLVYGHNMADGSMFGQLDRYAEEDFYRAHPTFTFDSLTEAGQWQVVAALRTKLGADDLPYYTFFDAADEAEWQQRVDAILALALYDTGITPAYGTQLLTLSTCGSSAVGTPDRFALLAMRIG